MGFSLRSALVFKPSFENVQTSSPPGMPQGKKVREEKERGAAIDPSVSVFVTPQSLVTFPVAMGVVTAISSVAKATLPTFGHHALVPVLASFAIGAAILFIGGPFPNPEGRRLSLKRRWAISSVVAIANSFVLAAAAIGVGGISSPASSLGASTPPDAAAPPAVAAPPS